MYGISAGFEARNGQISCPRAPPKGFAREASAVAETRPLGENQSSEYRVGAERTKGWASPMRIWPVIVNGKEGGAERVPA